MGGFSLQISQTMPFAEDGNINYSRCVKIETVVDVQTNLMPNEGQRIAHVELK